MLRNKYLLREVGKDYTFKSFILAERMYNYIISKLENIYSKMNDYNFKGTFIETNRGLNVEKINAQGKDIFGVYV